jgi:hypothetical protein
MLGADVVVAFQVGVNVSVAAACCGRGGSLGNGG